MKKRYIQFRKDKPHICINYIPDPSLGPIIQVSDERWARMYRARPSSWKTTDGVLVTPWSFRRVLYDYRKHIAWTTGGVVAAGSALAAALAQGLL